MQKPMNGLWASMCALLKGANIRTEIQFHLAFPKRSDSGSHFFIYLKLQEIIDH